MSVAPVPQIYEHFHNVLIRRWSRFVDNVQLIRLANVIVVVGTW